MIINTVGLILVLFGGSFAQAALPYVYPTQVEELRPYSEFPLPSLKVERSGNHMVLSYEVPRELSGRHFPIEFSGAWDPVTGEALLESRYGTAQCSISLCEIHYRALQLTEEDVVLYLVSRSETTDELLFRLRLNIEFGGRPISFISID